MSPRHLQSSTAVMEHSARHEALLNEPEEKLPINAAFKEAFRTHPGGVALVTADAGDGPVALTATSVSSVSMHPPVLMFSASKHSSSSETFKKAESVVVHFLNGNNLELAKLGATSGIDRFADTAAWERLPTGEPIFTAAAIWVKAQVIKRFDVAGSTVIICEARDHSLDELTTRPAQEGLAYVNGAWHRLSASSTTSI